MSDLPWQPIADCPPDLKRAIVYDPEMLNEHHDLRVSVATRSGDGTWRIDHNEGGSDVEPTHFCLINLPR